MGRARPPLGACGRRPRTRLLSPRARGGTHRRDGALGTAAPGVVGEARGALGDGVRVVGRRAAAPAVRSPAVGGAREVPRAPRAGFRHRTRRRHRRARPRADRAMLRFITPLTLARSRSGATAARGSAVTPRLVTLSIVRLSICEGVAILGVALFLLGGRWADFCGFAVASLAAFAFNFPRRS